MTNINKRVTLIDSEVDTPPTRPQTEAADILATPAVRRVANELNIDLNDVMMMSCQKRNTPATNVHVHIYMSRFKERAKMVAS